MPAIMGLRFSKSISIGPFRVNLSRSGVGYSVGGRGFRTGVSGGGRRYTTVSLPGTGLSHRTSHRSRGKVGCLVFLALPMLAAAALAAMRAGL